MPAQTAGRTAKLASAGSSLAVVLGAAAFVAVVGLVATSRLMLAVVKDFEVGDHPDDLVLAGVRRRPPPREAGGWS